MATEAQPALDRLAQVTRDYMDVAEEVLTTFLASLPNEKLINVLVARRDFLLSQEQGVDQIERFDPEVKELLKDVCDFRELHGVSIEELIRRGAQIRIPEGMDLSVLKLPSRNTEIAIPKRHPFIETNYPPNDYSSVHESVSGQLWGKQSIEKAEEQAKEINDLLMFGRLFPLAQGLFYKGGTFRGAKYVHGSIADYAEILSAPGVVLDKYPIIMSTTQANEADNFAISRNRDDAEVLDLSILSRRYTSMGGRTFPFLIPAMVKVSASTSPFSGS